MPPAANRSPMARLAVGAIVDMSIASLPSLMPSAAPSSPKRTASTSGESGSMVIAMSAAPAASAGVPAPVAPSSSASSAARAGLRFQTVSSKPATATFAAIGRPMIPSPRKATLVAATRGAYMAH